MWDTPHVCHAVSFLGELPQDKDKYTHILTALFNFALINAIPCDTSWAPLNDILSVLVGLNKQYTKAKKNAIYSKSNYCFRTE